MAALRAAERSAGTEEAPLPCDLELRRPVVAVPFPRGLELRRPVVGVLFRGLELRRPVVGVLFRDLDLGSGPGPGVQSIGVAWGEASVISTFTIYYYLI
jgi:hypothetical protein